MAEPFLLSVCPADGEPFVKRVEEQDLVIGRSSKVDLSVADPLMSREHARLYVLDGAWVVEDLGSHNGTFLNGLRLEGPAPLSSGDSLGMGGSTLAVLDEKDGANGGSSAAISEAAQTFSGASLFKPAAEMLRKGSHDREPSPTDQKVLLASLGRLRILNEVHQALSHSIAQQELLDLILDRAFSNLNPEEGAIYLKKHNGDYVCAASRSIRVKSTPMALPRSLVREVAEKGMAALVLDVQVDDRFSAAASIMGAGVRSVLAAPLMDAEGVLGMIVVSTTLAVKQYTEDDMELLVSLASVAALRIRNVALTEGAAEAMRLEQELGLARRIQLALLPDHLPEIPSYELHGGNLPSHGVSGDYYEMLPRNNGTEFTFWIADVCGKGIGAALLTASLEALSAGFIEVGREPDDVLTRVSRLLHARTPPEKYATAFMAVLDAPAGRLRYANAGHCRGLLVRAGGDVEWLGATGIPLGLMPEWTYEKREVELQAGDLFMLYTDGLTEAMNPESEEFGTERLAEVVGAHRAKPLKEIATAIERAMDVFTRGVPYADDRTIVMLRRAVC